MSTLQCLHSILRVIEDEQQDQEIIISQIVDWNDESKLQYQIAINGLHNYAVGKMAGSGIASEANRGRNLLQSEKFLRFAKNVEIEICIETKQPISYQEMDTSASDDGCDSVGGG